MSATVSNDSMNAGVSWSCAPANACGLFSPSSTASAVATTYTAPAVVPAGGQVTVTAKSITDPTKSASSVVMIFATASDANLSGQYAFFLTSHGEPWYGVTSWEHKFERGRNGCRRCR